MKYYFLDLFCGMGGASYGINSSKLRKLDIAEVVACVNHDANAIASHQLNHPEALHFVEDIRTLGLEPIINLMAKIRNKDPHAIICLWASIECTNFSNAKGGMSRDADSRTLAQHLFRYLDAINFDMVWIENVREFKSWGPLMQRVIKGKPQFIDKGKNKGEPIMIPVSHLKGIDYNSWVSDMKRYGYKHDDIVIDSADYGARTSRKRLFIQFVKEPLEIFWPEPTHDKLGRYGREKWLPVRPLLQLDETGESIFTRKKPMSDNTYDRVLRGVIKHKPQFFIKYYGKVDNTQSISNPCPTLTTKDRVSIVTKEQHLSYQYGKSFSHDLDQPSATIPTTPKGNLVTTQFLIDAQYKNNGSSIDKPCPTLIAKMDKKPRYLVSQFLEHYHGRKNTYKDINQPCTALATNPTQRLTSVGHFITSHYSPGTNKSVDEPCSTITCIPHESLTTVENSCTPIKIRRKDSESVRKLKTYMIENGISDIKMRPLFITEMLQIMGFPSNYKIVGTQTEAKKFIGNAVETRTARTLIYESFRKNIVLWNKRKNIAA